MNLISAFESGYVNNIPNFTDPPIETLLSKLFFTKDRVYKIYKPRPAFYGDMSEKNYRRDFYAVDFSWNNKIAPEIYLELCGVKYENNRYMQSPIDTADDYYIVMQRIDGKDHLRNRILNNQITPAEIQSVTRALINRLNNLHESEKDNLAHISARQHNDLHQESVNDLENWANYSSSEFSNTHAKRAIEHIRHIVNNESYFTNYNHNNLQANIDANCDNIIFLDDKISFLDILPPKESWRVNDRFFSLARLFVDIAVLGDKQTAQTIYDTCAEYGEIPSKNALLAHEIHAAVIQSLYRRDINQDDLAEKYERFVVEVLEEL